MISALLRNYPEWNCLPVDQLYNESVFIKGGLPMKCRWFSLAIITLVGVFLALDAGAESLDDLNRQLEETKQTTRDLEKRIQALEQEQASAVDRSQPDGKLTIYGYAQADLIQDFKRVDPDWNATLRPSKIPTVDGLYGEDGETIFSVRQTRIGVLSQVPLDWGDFSAKVEFDFFGVGSDAGQTTIRPRHLYGELGPILAGQTHSLFMDINVFPNSIDYWGPAGMVFYRNIQLRWTPVKGAATVAVALENPGNDVSWGESENPDPNGTLSSKNDLPDLTARVNYTGNWGYVQAGGILRKVGFETKGLPGNNPSDDAIGWGMNLSTNIKILQKDRIIFSTVYGEAIGYYMNDGGSDLVVVNGEAETLPLLGLVAFYDHYWNDSWSSSAGYSFTRIDNHDQQADDSLKKGEYALANLLWYPKENTMFGVEYLYGRREDKNGATGEDHRVQFSFKFSFDKSFGF
jgi:hypothetical protein